MVLTIQNLFNDPDIVSAVIDRVLQQHLDTIYWKQYGDFMETKQRVFKTYLGTVTGVVAGSIIGKNDEKPVRERRTIGSGYTEIAYLGDRYQIDRDRLSDLQDLIDKFNNAKTSDQQLALDEIVKYIVDDYRQIMLAPQKRMDLVVGSLLMTKKAEVYNADNKESIKMLDIDLPFNIITPSKADVISDNKNMFITYLMNTVQSLKAKYGVYQKMIMSRGTFVKNIIGSSEFNDKFKMILGSSQLYMGAGLITSQMASEVFTGLGLPAIEIKDDYVEKQDGSNAQIYADNHITLLRDDKVLKMRHHKPYVTTDPVPGRTYTSGEGQMSICNYNDDQGRYMEYTAEWIPEFVAPNKITNLDLTTLNA